MWKALYKTFMPYCLCQTNQIYSYSHIMLVRAHSNWVLYINVLGGVYKKKKNLDKCDNQASNVDVNRIVFMFRSTLS